MRGTRDQQMFFCEKHNIENLIRQTTYYRDPNNPTCINLIPTDVPRSFVSTCVIETGLSDVRLMTLIVIKKYFRKLQERIIN